jgi:thiol:disulfide interchange protein DsbC
VYGTGSRKIAVFEDPNCGYCKRFRRETLSKLQDTTVYTFVLPILGKDSLEKAQRVFCSDNKSKVWDDWMLNNDQPLGAGNCNTPINELLALGRSMNISGTPTVFFQDGTRVDGAIMPADLHRRIALAARSK